MWLDTIIESWIDFLTIIVGFSIAILGILTKTISDRKKWPKNVTLFGWILVVLAVVNLLFSWFENYQKFKKQEEVRYWAVLEIEQATCDLIVPYILNSDPPDSRFKLYDYLINFNIASGICNINLIEPVGDQYQIWALGSASETWAEVFTKHSERANKKLKEILANYSSVLSMENIELIGQLTTHPWSEFIEDSYKRQLRDQEMNPEIKILILGSNNKKLQEKYVKLLIDFGKKLELLENNIEKQYKKLHSRLQRNDPLPLFYRQYSGLIYLPSNPK